VKWTPFVFSACGILFWNCKRRSIPVSARCQENQCVATKNNCTVFYAQSSWQYFNGPISLIRLIQPESTPADAQTRRSKPRVSAPLRCCATLFLEAKALRQENLAGENGVQDAQCGAECNSGTWFPKRTRPTDCSAPFVVWYPRTTSGCSRGNCKILLVLLLRFTTVSRLVQN